MMNRYFMSLIESGGIRVCPGRALSVVCRCWLLLAVLMMGAGCGRSHRFEIDMTVSGGSTQNLEIFYDNGGGVSRSVVTLIDGKGVIEGLVDGKSVVEVFTSGGKLLGRTIVEGGDKIKWSIVPDDIALSTVSGNKDGEQLQQWLKEHFDADTVRFNNIIKTQIEQSPTEALSRILLEYFYNIKDPGEAGRLARLLIQNENSDGSIEDMVRSGLSASGDMVRLVEPIEMILPQDSVKLFDMGGAPVTILYVAAMERRSDTLANHVDAKRLGRGRLVVVRTTTDTIFWRDDRLTYKQPGVEHLWAPGGQAWPPLNRLKLPRLPWVIVTDSTASVIMETGEIDEAVDFIEKLK